ncbi:helix-turn-helix domain-containing protein [Paractinoplanes lichenicola]|uniref:Helix-turn-helix domain-containing protein n=1 Tax=Paractinoplanes lichenicola TaxID=2802976 RepID=A0ABS1W0Y7_9ACTN|nr:helix-turn-helix transcriptional regulator [Actinoplanes lichenicola]MBL7260380.1 helix-turn-helix domain-containing protein [Actinoplanes lichenicola]
MSDASDRSVVPTETVGPKIARANVALRLKSLRDGLGLSAAAVAKTMDWSVSKLTRIEKGEVTVQPLEVRALLGHYHISDEHVVAELSRLARLSRSRQWYSRHRLAGAFADFVAFENEAAEIHVWQLLFVPGLLQTRDYARAITARTLRTDPNDEQVKARVDLRMDRQEALFERQRGDSPPRVTVVFDESALRRPLGGHEVMARQLDHLLALAEDPQRFVFGVAPLDLEHHSGLGGSFELLKFAGTHDDVMFVEAAAGYDFLVVNREETDRHNALFKDLLDYGRTGDRALQTIRSIRDEMRAG